ncbi:S8 family peptidase [Jidongwangia harbinensis]|uniref:S8 family peptidase n=1 Tax=Jidongwangia harbinensis TaxID=2878561 RepID=UPI001CDA1A9A|nr:S8/S53 family peptidase [Jidongwangia harbinensis]MCA2218970.1 S8/S53 family peptidase [Jidongwangia harbinensis]
MKFEKDRLGYAFEEDYPESYGPADLARLRAILPQQISQLGQGTAGADARLLGILIGRRCGDQGRAQVEARSRRDGALCLLARGEVVLPAAEFSGGTVGSLFTGFAPPPAVSGRRGAHVRMRRPAASASEVDRIVDACGAAKVPAWPNYLATMAAVGKGLGGPEPTPPPPPPPPAPGARAARFAAVGTEAAITAPPAAEGGTVRVAIIDTGIPRSTRPDGWLNAVRRTDDNIDVLDMLPAGPDGLLDFQAGHGTFVAGIVQRVAPQADIRMYRAADTDGFATDAEIAEAILRAHDDGAQIINLSLGIRTVDDQPPPATAEAVSTVVRESAGQTVIIAAAGNHGDRSVVWPAALDGVEAVAGLTAFLTPATWSNYGDVRFSTVAEGIRSTYVGGTESPVFDSAPDRFDHDAWAIWSGTSFAAPQIAGAVARISYEEGMEPRAAVDKLDAYGKEIHGFGKAMRILQGLG